MHVLLSNDDGIDAEGLQILRSALREACPDSRITTVAPDREQSGSSHSLTLTQPLRITERGDGQYSVSGTPTDCVLIALNGILRDDPPDVVISGINHGPNMGEDVHYSGTVAAAFEGKILGLPSIALSLASRRRPYEFGAARRFVMQTLPGWLRDEIAKETLLNVNIPSRPNDLVRGIRVCRLGSRRYDDMVVRKVDPRGRNYYWLGGEGFTVDPQENTDFVLAEDGWITVTPLHVDLSDYKRMVDMEGAEEDW
jgi:5'-nucleotidase